MPFGRRRQEAQNSRQVADVQLSNVTLKRRAFLKHIAAVLTHMSVSPLLFSQTLIKGKESERINWQLRLTLTLTNSKPHELVDQIIWLYLPVAETSTQKLNVINISVPYQQHIDLLGQTIVTLVFSKIAPLSTKVVNMSLNLSMSTVPRISSLDNSHAWLGSERYIETSDYNIKSLAATLKRKESRDTAFAIYDWVKRHLNYTGYVADDRGAAYSLNQLQGDCTEYAYLIVALARANGIPARMLGGYTVDRNTILRAVDYHNWAELYFDGAWQLLDAQKQNWLTPSEQYVAFHFYSDQEINPIGLAHRYRQSGDLEISY